MHLSSKIKLYFYKLKENKRYKKFKDCNLPYPFFDSKRDTFEWVKYTNKQCIVEPNLLYAIGDIARAGVTYHYKANAFEFVKDKKFKCSPMINHCHSFDEVIQALYDYPESFIIPDEFLYEYSNQELRYLKQTRSYLHLIGLKDIKRSKEINKLDMEFDRIYAKKHKNIKDKLHLKNYDRKLKKIKYEDNLKRYSNSKVLEYQSYCFMNIDKKQIAKAIMSGKKDYLININYSFSKPTKNEKYLVSYDSEFLGIVESYSEEILKFKDLKEDMINYKLTGFKSFQDYKNDMKEKFKKDAKIYNEDFTDESLINYAKLKIIEKFYK